MSEIKTKLNDAVKEAMRAKDKERLSTLRLATSALKQIEVDERIELDDTRVLAVLDKMVKQRKDSAQIYIEQNRPELAEGELAEAKIIEEYLPQQMTEEELETALKAIIAESGATSAKDMGKVMGIATKQLAGKAEGKAISAKVKELLA